MNTEWTGHRFRVPMRELSFSDILDEAMRNAALYRIILRMTISESQAEVADLPEPDVVVEGTDAR